MFTFFPIILKSLTLFLLLHWRNTLDQNNTKTFSLFIIIHSRGGKEVQSVHSVTVFQRPRSHPRLQPPFLHLSNRFIMPSSQRYFKDETSCYSSASLLVCCNANCHAGPQQKYSGSSTCFSEWLIVDTWWNVPRTITPSFSLLRRTRSQRILQHSIFRLLLGNDFT